MLNGYYDYVGNFRNKDKNVYIALMSCRTVFNAEYVLKVAIYAVYMYSFPY